MADVSANALSEFVRQRRMELDITLSELARQCGIEKSNISRIEAGRHTNLTLESVRRLAKGLRLPYWRLVAIAYGDEAFKRELDDDLKRSLVQSLYEELPEDKRALAVDFLRMLARRDKAESGD